MSLTKVTNEVIGLSTITPDKLTQGGPNWSQFGGLSAVAFVGDGSGLTNVFPAVSVVEITDSVYTIRPEDNNFTLVFPQYTDIDLLPTFQYTPGHKTTLIQSGTGEINIVVPEVYNVNDFTRTKGQYSKAFLQFIDETNGWTLYGDLTSAPVASYNLVSDVASFLEGAECTITLNTANVPDGNIPYTVSGTINTADLSAGSAGLIGNFNLVGGTASVVFRLSSDGVVEGNEYINLSLDNGQDSISVLVVDTGSLAPALPAFAQVASGHNHSLALSGSTIGRYKMYMTGSNSSGELGLNNTTPRSVFTSLTGEWAKVDAGLGFSVALSGSTPGNYDLYVAGNNSYGQLGLNNILHRSTFTKIANKWTDAVAGPNTTFALSGNDLYCAGRNQYGELGLNNAYRVTTSTSFDYKDKSTFTQIPGTWSFFAGGTQYNSAAISGGIIYTAGFGGEGLLANNSTTSSRSFQATSNPDGNWSKCSCVYGGSTVFALSINNNLYGSGNISGVGLRSTWTQLPGKFLDIADGSTGTFYELLALSAVGSKLCFTRGSSITELPGTWSGVELINGQTIKHGGTFYGIGSNYMGKLGTNNTTNRSTLTQLPGTWTKAIVGLYSSMALNSSGQLFFAGQNFSLFRSTFTQVPAQYIPSGLTISDLLAHGNEGDVTFITANGQTYAIGGFYGGDQATNQVGDPGVFTLVPGGPFTQVKCSTNAFTNHTLAKKATNTLYVAGSNTSGQLGTGEAVTSTTTSTTTWNYRSSFTKIAGSWIAASAGTEHTLALSGTTPNQYELYSTGYNTFGQLGINNRVDRSTFTKVAGNWSAIAAGQSHSLALSGAKLFISGSNSYGQLGLNHVTNRSTFTQVSGDWTAIAAGDLFSLALSGTKLYACGYGVRGQLGTGDTNSRSTFTLLAGDWNTIHAGADHVLALSGTTLNAVGFNSTGQLGINSVLQRTAFTQVTQVSG